jgi:hypothetical protein
MTWQGQWKRGLEKLCRGRGREKEGTEAGSNEPAGARTKEGWGTLAEAAAGAGAEAEAGAGAGKSNELAGAMNKGLR